MTDILAYPIGVPGGLTRVLECGTGPDAVIFVHGLGARADRWRSTMVRFAAEGYRCFAFDLPGHGFATKGPDAFASVPEFATVLDGVLDALGLDRVILVGTSLGGHVAAWFTLQQPGRVRGLVLVGAVGLVPLSAEAGDAIRRNVRQTSREAIDGKLRFVFNDPAPVTAALVEEEFRINNSPGAAEGFARLGDYIADGINAHIVGDRLAALRGTVPLLLVWGGGDRAVPLAVGQAARRVLGDPDLAVIEGAGHAPYMERPEAFAAATLPFLAGCRATAGS
jgi:2-hydroxy-6-oxonona-2,4-dienedioate hydrolase